ncbi:hypothetical protein ACFZCK_14215 [Kitasatospora purpeofusca]|uniref:hypothetical protein n=1 Tax=Kitasatospora purpeofusca TaxID=67352 RepID=UPI0036E59E13
MNFRPPALVTQGEYDASDFRRTFADLRGRQKGVIWEDNPKALKVEAVADANARVRVYAGDAWVPVWVEHRENPKSMARVRLLNDISFNLTGSSTSGDRIDIIVAQVHPNADDSTTITLAQESPAADYDPGTWVALWGVKVIKGNVSEKLADVQKRIPESCIVLGHVTVKAGTASTLGAASVQDARGLYGQSDTTCMYPAKTVPGQAATALAGSLFPGQLVYHTDSGLWYRKETSGEVAEAFPRAFRTDASYQAPEAAWGNEAWHTFTAPAAAYPRLVTVTFEVTYNGYFGEGWYTPVVWGHGERRRAGRPQYARANDGRDARGCASIRVPAGTPLAVYSGIQSDNTANYNCKFTAAWTSYAEAVITPGSLT